MKRWLAFVFLFCATQVHCLESQPWLGNWLEFEASLYQTHTQSHTVDTKEGTKHKFLHAEKTMAAIEFMSHVDFSTELELDLTKTQKRSYGFEAIKASCRYRLLNDLTGDPVCLTAGLVAALSTPSRVKDLSSQQHGVFDLEGRIAFGREFGHHETSFYKTWALIKSGLASSGSGWVGGEVHVERIIHDRHHIDVFVRAEKGLSHHKLHHLSDFHSWSRIGYEYEEVGLTYSLKQIALGSFYIEGTTRLHARFCPKHTWSLRLGFMIPFSPW